MIWQLVKRDPGWRNALNYASVSAVAGAVAPHEFIGMFGVLVAMCWFGSEPQRRATLFQAALPIRACDLFLARILSLMAGVWLPVASGAALLLLAGKPAEDAATLVAIGATLSVSALVMQSSRVSEISGSEWAYLLVAIAWAAAWPIAVFVPRTVVLGACALLCGLLFRYIWKQLPTTFEVLPARPTRQVARRGSIAAPAFVWWPILRSLFQPKTLLFLPMLVIMPPLSNRWLYGSMFCFLAVQTALVNIPWTLGLPVRRGALLAAALLPWLTLLLLGVLLGNWFGPDPAIPVEWSAPGKISEIRPPLEFWHLGEAPIIKAPWGESWHPQTVRLNGIAVYNPYGHGPANSTRFRYWQFQRATQAVYGVPIDPAEYTRHRHQLRPLMRQTRLAILNLAACACWVLFLFNVAFTALHWRFRRVFDHGQTVLGWLLVVPILCVFLTDWLPENHWAGPISPSLVNALLLRVSALLPAGLPAVGLAAVLPVVLLSWTAARLFRGAEISPAAPARQ